MVTKQDVFQMMERFGIRRDDKVTMHTSLKAIGPIENGAEGLLDALREYLCDGLLLIPTHTWMEIAQKRYYYDPKITPPCIGVLPQIAAFHPDAVRSLHPTHSMAVFGKGAAEYVSREKDFSTAGGADNCLSRLYDEHGKILLVGVGLESNTYLHCMDERLQIPNRTNETAIPITIRDRDGSTFVAQFHSHKVKGLTLSVSAYYPNLEKPFAHLGALTYGTLGNAKVMCCDAVKTEEALRLLWSKAEFDLCFGEREIPEEYYK